MPEKGSMRAGLTILDANAVLQITGCSIFTFDKDLKKQLLLQQENER
jgi:hypothetical protein